jgi:hypothetical protein
MTVRSPSPAVSSAANAPRLSSQVRSRRRRWVVVEMTLSISGQVGSWLLTTKPSAVPLMQNFNFHYFTNKY